MTTDETIRCQAKKCKRLLGAGNHTWGLDDLINEGYLCLRRTEEKWKPDGGASFSTFLHRGLRNHFWGIVRKHYRKKPCKNIDESMYASSSFLAPDRLSLLSKRAQQFMKLVFSPPPELRSIIKGSGTIRLSTLIARYLDWSPKEMKVIKTELFDSLLVPSPPFSRGGVILF